MRYAVPFRSFPALSLDTSSLPAELAAGDEVVVEFPDVTYRAVDLEIPGYGARLTQDVSAAPTVVFRQGAMISRDMLVRSFAAIMGHLLDMEAKAKAVVAEYAPLVG